MLCVDALAETVDIVDDCRAETTDKVDVIVGDVTRGVEGCV